MDHRTNHTEIRDGETGPRDWTKRLDQEFRPRDWTKRQRQRDQIKRLELNT